MRLQARILRSTFLSPLLVTAVAFLPPDASAASPNWTSTSSTSWTTGSNWSTGTGPLAADTVTINNGATGPNIVAAGATASSVQVGSSSGGTGALAISGSGVLTDANGYVGAATGSLGTASITGTSANWANTTSLFVGNSGSGTLTIQSGGHASDVTSGVIGSTAGSNGTAIVTGSGSSWTNSATFYVGNVGTGTLYVQNGGSVSDVTGYIGFATGSLGTATVTGSGSVWNSGSGGLYVGNNGTGALTVANNGELSVNSNTFIGTNTGALDNLAIQSGGTASIVGQTIFGYHTGAVGNGDITGAGSLLTSTSTIYVGYSGNGALIVENAGVANSANYLNVGDYSGSTGTLLIRSSGTATDVNAEIGYNLGSTGTATVTGTGSNWTTSGSLQVGGTGVGALTISSGGVVTDATGYIGYATGSFGTATVTGSGSTWTNTGNGLDVGTSGTGTLNITNGGSVSVTSNSQIGAISNSSGSASIDGSGSIWSSVGYLEVGASGTSTLSISGGGTVKDANGYIGTNPGSVGTATVTGSGSTWNNGTGTLAVGNNGNGSLTVNSGGTVSDGVGNIGSGTGTHGTAAVTGSGSSWTNTGNLIVGNSGTGALTISDGASVTDGGIGYLGYGAGSSGTAMVTGSGSVWNATSLRIGNNGNGSLTIADGGSVTGNGNIGNATGSLGTATVTGSGSTWNNGTGTLYVGNSGTGWLTISSGGAVMNASGYIGSVTGSLGTATVTGTGSTWNNGTGTLQVGGRGTGTLTIQNGATVSDGTGYIATYGGSLGTAIVTGSGSSWNNTNGFYVGNSYGGTGGNAFLTISNGGTINDTNGFISAITGALGTALLTDSGSSWSNSGVLDVGYAGTGSLTIQNGAAATSNSGGVGLSSSGMGTLVVTGSGSSWNSGIGGILIGDSGTGSLTIADGGVVGSATTYIANQSGSVGTLNIGAAPGSSPVAPGTLSAATVAFGLGTGVINFNHTSSDYVFAPAITGSGTINAYAGTTELTGDLSGFTGTTNLLGGDLLYSFASGSGTGSTINTALAGSGALSIASGGITYLASDSSAFTGTTTVQNGSTLSVNGELGGTLDVDAGATLKGHGTTGNVTTASGAILAPGNSIGTLTVSSLTVAPGTIYQAEVNAAGASDLIHSTGTATINGGTVDVIAAPGNYVAGTRYTILTADGGVMGTFDSLTGSFSSLFLAAGLSYDADDVYLDVRQASDFASVARTRNQAATAGAVQSLGGGNAVYDAFALQDDPTAARQGLNSLSGVAHVSNQAALLNEQSLLSDALLARMDSIADARPVTRPFQVAYQGQYLPGDMMPAPTGQAGVWMQGFGDWSQLSGSANAPGIHDQSNGVLIGADTQLSDHWQGGGAFGYSHSYLSSDADDGHSDSDNYHAALYAQTHIPQGPDLRFGGSYTWHQLDNRRAVDFSGYGLEGERADSAARSAQLFADVSQPITLLVSHPHGTATTIAPYATLAYEHEEGDGFTENGGPAALSVGDSSMDLLASTLGARLRQNLTFAPSSAIRGMSLTGSMGWKHTMGDITPSTAMRFATGGSSFVIDGDPLARDAFVYNASVGASLTSASSLALTYQGQMADQTQEQTIEGRFSYSF